MSHRPVPVGVRLSLLAAAAAAALSACMEDRAPPKPDDNAFPAKFKEEIVAYMPKLLQDPTNIKDAFVSDPVLTPVGNAQRWTSCVRFNPRVSGRRYSGSEDRFAVFYAGNLSQFIPATKEQCAKAAYKPFPELEKICLAERCR